MSESIGQVIYGGAPRAPQQRWLLAGLLAVAMHVGLLILALESEPTLEFWASDLATRVHKELSRMHEVPIEPATPPREEPPPPTPPTARRLPTADNRSPTTESRQPKTDDRPPAAAADIVAAENVPVDFTGSSIVIGTASVYAGGVTTSSGTSATAVPHGTPVGVKSQSSSAKAVEPASADWGCPWPAEAERADVNEESATVRVVVDASGTPLSVRVLRDPGFGFGRAAAACAMRERYNPARNADGNAVRAESSPIRVTFSR